jgi:predicted TIM-barrel fold metal-dependent hydrolase
MISRRDILKSAAIAGVAAFVGPATPARRGGRGRASASQPATPVDFDVPRDACDCHTHIFDPARFPFAVARSYTPEPASIAELLAMHRALHIDRVVLVQPSVYGADNSCLLDALKQLSPNACGVAVVDGNTTDADLDAMSVSGVRGLRINFQTGGPANPDLARSYFRVVMHRASAHNLHVQIYSRLDVIETLADRIMVAPVPIVFDHFGGAQAALGVTQPGFDTLLSLVRAGKAYVKLSGAYRASTEAPDYADVAPLARALIAANPERILWGTDWPHPDSSPQPGRAATDIAPLLRVDDGELFNQFAKWAPEASLRKMILVDNPTKLYGFGSLTETHPPRVVPPSPPGASPRN